MSLNDKIIELAQNTMRPEDNPPPDGGGVPSENSNSSEEENSGTILMDATYAPADIRYPTDLNLVNEARKLTTLNSFTICATAAIKNATQNGFSQIKKSILDFPTKKYSKYPYSTIFVYIFNIDSIILFSRN